ncbi:MAG TPA: ABC transporter permease [Candidatus Angelobacter sp.]|nr:ABC transporter permease [Candidatus Angelobacter sp.]
MEKQRKTTWLTGFLAVLYYEFLWNLRKKKIVGLFILVFAIVTLELALPPLLDYYNGVPFTANSNIVFDFFNGLSGIFLFLIAVATTMNTISGEFETGSITPLLTKPVSKNTVFLGKIVASFLTLLGIYAFLTVYVTLGGILIEGSQNNLQLVPLGLVGLTLATMVWGSLVILLGALSKSSFVAALGSFGVWIGVTIAGSILGSVFGQTTILFYAPGGGATGSTATCTTGRLEAGGTFSTGTDNLGYMLMQWVLNAGNTLNFCGFRFRGGATETFLASSDTIANVALRDLGVTVAYLAVFLFLSWYAFRRAQIIESA